MAGWRQTWRPLQLLVIFSLLILTNQTEKREKAEEKLNLRGTSQEELHISSPSLKNKELLHRDKVLDASLVGSDQQTMADRLQNTAEVCPCSTQEVLVPTRSSDPSDGNTRQENGSEPQQRLPVSRKLYNQTVCGSEPDQQNPQMDQVAHEADPVSRTPRASRTCRAAPSPDDPLVQFDQQQIVMLADDEVVRTAAASLFHKHPAVSSLHAVRPRHRVRQVKGQAAPLSERSSLVLVGHGAREPSGEMRISGYSYQDVARIIQSSSRIGQKIQTTAVVACGAGSDRRFPQALLQTLHRAGLETELHLWETAVQVAETGDVLSQDGARWRSGDHSKKLVLTVGWTGEIRRRDDRRNCTGQEVPTSQTALLGIGDNKDTSVDPCFDKYRSSWPDKPRQFATPECLHKIFETLKQNVEYLEALSWGFFHPNQPIPDKADLKNFNMNNYVVGKRDQNGEINWLTKEDDVKELLKKCYVIKSGKDIRNIIRHFAKDGETEITYLMVNNWIYEVDPQTLYVYPVGKKRNQDPKSQSSAKQLKQVIESQKGKSGYPAIKEGLQKSVEKPKESITEECAQYFRGVFSFKHPVYIRPVTTEAWCTTYFTASVISESARNLRTFPLILMALDLTEKKKNNMKDGLSFLFDEHSMARGGSWIDPSRRGFSGSATPEDSSKLKNKRQNRKTEEELLDDLKNVIYREDIMFTNWQKSIEGPHDYKTYVEKMAEIAETFTIIRDPSSKTTFKTNCKNFRNVADEEKQTPNIW